MSLLHGREVCSCGALIRQCRCPSRTVRIVQDGCGACQTAQKAVSATGALLQRACGHTERVETVGPVDPAALELFQDIGICRACRERRVHRWSGWPGSFCLDCGVEDALEACMGLHHPFDPAAVTPANPYGMVACCTNGPCPSPGENRANPYVRAHPMGDADDDGRSISAHNSRFGHTDDGVGDD